MNVDYLKSSHVKASVIDDFIQSVDYKYGDPEIGEVKSTRGKNHNCSGMTLNYYQKSKVKIDMIYYVKKMNNDSYIKLYENDTATTPTNENL